MASLVHRTGIGALCSPVHDTRCQILTFLDRYNTCDPREYYLDLEIVVNAHFLIQHQFLWVSILASVRFRVETNYDRCDQQWLLNEHEWKMRYIGARLKTVGYKCK